MALTTIVGAQIANMIYGCGVSAINPTMALMTSAYVFDAANGVYSATDETSGTGYTAGGTLSSSTFTITGTPAASWPVTWVASTAYLGNQVVAPPASNGYVYRCLIAGTSGATAPTFSTTVGALITDGTITWINAGTMISVLTSGPFSWTSSTVTASFGIIYANSGIPNIGLTNGIGLCIDFGGSVSSLGGTFTVAPDPTYGWCYFTQA